VIPGVQAAGFVTFVPMTFQGGSTGVLAEGQENVAPEDRAADVRPEFTISYQQWDAWSFFMPRDLVIRADADPGALVDRVRGVIQEVDPNMPLSFARTMDNIVAASTAGKRLNMQLFASLGIAALILASLGVYGVIAYTVAQRSREIGVRMALGARVSDVLGMILRQGGALVAAGLAIGMAIAWFAARRMEDLLYGIDTLDAMTFIAVPLLLGLVALIAIVIPARRASRIDPVVALRAD
jgi:putative ABC transport system permease protein